MAGYSETVNLQVNAIGNFSNVIGEVSKLQSRLQALKLPKNLGGDAAKGLTELQEKFTNLQNLANRGIKSKADFNAFEKAAKEVDVALKQVEKGLNSISNKKIRLNMTDSDEIKQKIQELERFKKEAADALNLKNLGTKNASGIFNISKISEIQQSLKEGTAGAKNFQNVINSFKSGSIDQVSTALQKLVSYAKQYEGTLNDSGGNQRGTQLLAWAREAQAAISSADAKIDEFNADINQMRVDQFNKMASGANGLRAGFDGMNSSIRQSVQEMRNMAASSRDMHSQLGSLQTQANYFFGLQNMFQLFRRNIQDTFNTVKELDKAMTETAVVTDFSVSDMWKELPRYTQTANQLGATIKGAYETMTLYYQQGLNTEEAFAVGTETMKMARIAGLDYAQTTNMMTAALRGFNMEINNASAKRVNDVYSELAAVTASDTRELGLAMERTASIAHSAGMDFGNTTAFLAQMIETTREAPENLGTAMKTIIARFQELKENPYGISEVEGEEVDFNRVDKALKTIGVDLMDNKDKFRDLDDVFMDISERWDGLSQTQQRYIATIAAGARQQSRFLAMVGNYDRLKQLTDAAANSAGASDVQFAKTLDSMEAKLNRLRNAWDQFAMGIANNKILKGFVDFGVTALDTVNKVEDGIQDLFGGFNSIPGSIAKSITSLTALWAAFKVGGKIVDTSIGLLGGFLGVTKVKGASLFGGISGQRSAANMAQAAAISNPIVSAINNAAARITNSEKTLGQSIKAQSQKNFNRQDFRSSQRALRFDEKVSHFDPQKGKSTLTTKNFTGLDVTKNLKGYTEDQQRVLLQQVPGTRRAIERSYQEATKKLNLTDSSENVVNQLHKQISQEMMRPGSGISPEAGMYIMGNPRELSKYISDEAVLREVKKGIQANQKQILGEVAKEDRFKNLKGYERINALKRYRKSQEYNQREAALYNPTARLTDDELKANKYAGLTAGATAAGQAVMNLGVALDNLGLHGAGGILTSIGSTMTSVGLAASGAVEGVLALKTALSGMGIALGPLAAVAAGITALGTAAAIAYKKRQDSIKEIRKEGKEIATTYNDAIDKTTTNLAKLNDYRVDFARLSQGVDSNGNNINLGAEEYNDYLKIVKEITDMQPELIKGYNAQGNIIVDNNAVLKEAIKLEQKQQEEAKKTFTSQDSINKMALARSTTKRWQVGQSTSDRIIATGRTAQTLKGTSQLNSDFQDLISSIGKLENGEAILSNLANTYNLTVDDFKNGTKEAIQAVNDYGGNMSNYIKESIGENVDEDTEELFNTINKSISKVGEDWSGMEEVSKDIMDSLLLYAGEKGYTEKIHSSLQGVFNDAVKDIALFEDPENMLSSVDSIGKEFSTLGGHLDEYNEILETVEEAQTQFGKDLDLNNYQNSVSDSIEQLQEWKAVWDESTDSTSQALSEWAQTQIESFSKVQQGAIELSDAFNTMSGRVASSNSAYETWQKQNEEGDLYTGVENFKKMMDEVNDDIDNLGKGSNQWWTAAQSMFGDDYIFEHSKQEIQSHMKDVSKYLEEGSDGIYTFMNDLSNNLDKNLDTDFLGFKNEKNKKPYKISDFIELKDGELDFTKLNEAPEEAFSAIADALGQSDDLFTALLNKARQFGNIQFGNVEDMRTALATSDSTIAGKGTTGGNRNLYTRESDFRTQALEAGVRPEEIKRYQSQLEKTGTIFLKGANEINKGQLSKYIKDWGINVAEYQTKEGQTRYQTTSDAFIKYFDKLGYSKDEISQIYDTAGKLIKDNEKVDFNEAYQKAHEANADPAVAAATSIDGKVGSILSVAQSIATAMGVLTSDTKKGIEEGTKTTNEHATDLLNGNPEISYTQAKSEVENDLASLKETKNELEVGQANFKEGSKKWNEFQTQIDQVNASIKLAEDALNTVTKSQYEAAQAQTEINNLAKSIGGQKALEYYNKNGFGNTDPLNRQVLDWDKEGFKTSNFENAKTWGWTKEDLKGSISTYMSGGLQVGEGENAIQIPVTPMLQTESGTPEVLSQDTVQTYLNTIAEKATDENGKINIADLMKFDQEGTEIDGKNIHDLIMGAFTGEGAEEASGALGQLEHLISESIIPENADFGGLKQAAQNANVLKQNLASTGVQGKQAADNLTSSFLRLNEEGLKGLNDADFNTVISSLGMTRAEVQAIDDADPTINLRTESDTTQLDQTTDEIEAEESTEHVVGVSVEVTGDEAGNTGGLIDNVTSEAQQAAGQTVSVPFTAEPTISNPDAVSEEGLKEKANIPETIDAGKIPVKAQLTAGKVSTKGLKGDIKGKAQSAASGIKVSAKAKTTSTVNYKLGEQEDPKEKGATVNYNKIGEQVSPTSKSASVSYDSISYQKPPETKHAKVIYDEKWKGKNNFIAHRTLPTFNSFAVGNVKKQPKIPAKLGNGLTLTGERGFEIAWLPSQNRSMILGADGPQMLNLPDDAVIWNNRQSKKIIKQKPILANSFAGGNPGGTFKLKPNTGSSTTIKTNNVTVQNRNSGGGGGGGGDDKKKRKAEWKIVKKGGKVTVWWENLARKTDAIQRKIDKALKRINKAVEKIGQTLRETGLSVKNGGAGGDNYIKRLRQQIRLNKTARKRANNELTILNLGQGGLKSQVNKNRKKVNRAKKKLDKAELTDSKKDDKQARKRLKRARKALKRSKKLRKWSKADIENGGATTSISYEVTKKKGKKTETETKKQRIDLGKYIKRDKKTGTLVINQKAIDKVSKDNKSKGKAIKDAAESEINKRIQRKNSAQDAIEKSKEALDEFGKKLYETFLGWENELTRIWNITEKISEIESRRARVDSFSELLKSRIANGTAGFTKDENGNTIFDNSYINLIQDTFKKGVSEQFRNLQANLNSIEFQKANLQNLLSITDEKATIQGINARIQDSKEIQSQIDLLKDERAKQEQIKAKAKSKKKKNKADDEIDRINKEIEELKEQKLTKSEITALQYQKEMLKADKEVFKLLWDKDNGYLRNSKINQDGTISIQFDTEKFEEDRQHGDLNAETATKIQDYVKELAENSKELSDTYKTLTENLVEMQTALADLQEAWSGYSEDLLSYLEEEQSQEIDKIKTLSDSIHDALNDLLDQVKKSLEERRNREDNLKTEQDISRKQQRLAALRADTAGGHQVEIAQLEKEIAEAQTDYGRTLEDQLLDRLSAQADEASQQRQRQIELQESINNAVNNRDLVNKWMANPRDFQAEIQKAFFAANEWEKMPLAKQEQIERDFWEFYEGLITNEEQRDYLEFQISNTEPIVEFLKDTLGDIEINTDETSDNADAILKQIQGDVEAARNAAVNAENKSQEVYDVSKQQQLQAAYNTARNDAISGGTINKNEFLKVLDAGNALDMSNWDILSDLAKTTQLNWEEILTAAKAAGKSAKWAKKLNPNASKTSEFRKAWEKIFKTKNWDDIKFASGGLANFTGPAWLDGTPSKPELVLNAQDTKNFMALRDVLGKATNSLGSVDNSNNPMMFEINVNVDHINNDYDVDKIASRIKKDIIKDAGYRNVTQVRNFR